MIDYTNREGYDNREYNLQETNYKKNALNCKLMKNNTSGYNGISYDKVSKRFRFYWIENKKLKSKSFKSKQEAINFKLAHDKQIGNRNRYSVIYFLFIFIK